MNQHFHKPKSGYFLSHSVGCLPVRTQSDLAEKLLTPWKTSGGDAWPDWLNSITLFCDSLANLLGGRSEEYCPQSNLSSGFTKFLMALPQQVNRKVILMHADAFPTMGFVAQALASHGYQLKLIEHSQPAHHLDSWLPHLNQDVAVALITHVHSNTGVVSPVNDLAMLCKERGIVCTVDVAQSAGILPIDIVEWQVDAVFGSCVKWLCGGPGAGFMWVNSALTKQLKPLDVGWFSHENPFAMDIRDFHYASDAKRFWGGTPAVAPYIIATSGIELISAIGVEEIFAHNRILLNTVLKHLPEGIFYPIELERNGGTLCLRADAANIEKLAAQFQQRKMFFDKRGNTLRLSMHIYNSSAEADEICEGIEQALLIPS